MSLSKLDANQVLRSIFSEHSNGIKVESSFVDTASMLDAQDAGVSANSEDVDISSHQGYAVAIDWSDAESGGATIAEHSTILNTFNTSMQSSDYYGQSFLAEASASISNISLEVWNSDAATGSMTIEIWSDVAGQPGVLLGTSDSVDAADMPITNSSTDFPFSTPVAVTASTSYIMLYNSQSLGGFVRLNYEDPGTYDGGDVLYSDDSGTTYTADPTSDNGFVITSAAGSLDGVVKIQASLDGVVYHDLSGLAVDIDSASGSELLNVSDAQYKLIRANYDSGAISAGMLNVKYFLKG